MGLDIYLKEDLADILASAEVASQATALAAGLCRPACRGRRSRGTEAEGLS